MPKILVIDDKINICEAIRYIFKDDKYQVMYALTGKEGLEMFEAERPNIVILDMHLLPVQEFKPNFLRDNLLFRPQQIQKRPTLSVTISLCKSINNGDSGG